MSQLGEPRPARQPDPATKPTRESSDELLDRSARVKYRLDERGPSAADRRGLPDSTPKSPTAKSANLTESMDGGRVSRSARGAEEIEASVQQMAAAMSSAPASAREGEGRGSKLLRSLSFGMYGSKVTRQGPAAARPPNITTELRGKGSSTSSAAPLSPSTSSSSTGLAAAVGTEAPGLVPASVQGKQVSAGSSLAGSASVRPLRPVSFAEPTSPPLPLIHSEPLTESAARRDKKAHKDKKEKKHKDKQEKKHKEHKEKYMPTDAPPPLAVSASAPLPVPALVHRPETEILSGANSATSSPRVATATSPRVLQLSARRPAGPPSPGRASAPGTDEGRVRAPTAPQTAASALSPGRSSLAPEEVPKARASSLRAPKADVLKMISLRDIFSLGRMDSPPATPVAAPSASSSSSMLAAATVTAPPVGAAPVTAPPVGTTTSGSLLATSNGEPGRSARTASPGPASLRGALSARGPGGGTLRPGSSTRGDLSARSSNSGLTPTGSPAAPASPAMEDDKRRLKEDMRNQAKKLRDEQKEIEQRLKLLKKQHKEALREQAARDAAEQALLERLAAAQPVPPREGVVVVGVPVPAVVISAHAPAPSLSTSSAAEEGSASVSATGSASRGTSPARSRRASAALSESDSLGHEASSPVSPRQPALVRDEEWKRARIIEELISTERDYVRDLVTLREVYLMPLRSEKVLAEAVITSIFANVAVLLNVNKELLKDLSAAATVAAQRPSDAAIGPCFLRLADYLKMYSAYCTNQDAAADTLKLHYHTNAKLREFLDAQFLRPEARGQPLASYLIKPVQRLCKYPLLLRELLQRTPPSHVDHEALSNALNKLQLVVTQVNEHKRKFEAMRRVEELRRRLVGAAAHELVAPDRRLLREGTAHVYVAALGCEDDATNLARAHLVLFNDLLLACELVTDADDPAAFVYRARAIAPLADATLRQLPDGERVFGSQVSAAFDLDCLLDAGRKGKVVFGVPPRELPDWIREFRTCFGDRFAELPAPEPALPSGPPGDPPAEPPASAGT